MSRADPVSVRLRAELLAWYQQHADDTGIKLHRALVLGLEAYAAQNEAAPRITHPQEPERKSA